MNEPDSRDLIEGLISDETAEHAPSEADVLGLVRRERRHRARRRAALGGVAATTAAVLLLLPHPAPEDPVVSNDGVAPSASATAFASADVAPPVPEPEAPSARIPRLSDEEMLDFLGDAPVALVTRSDGSRALIMLTGAP